MVYFFLQATARKNNIYDGILKLVTKLVLLYIFFNCHVMKVIEKRKIAPYQYLATKKATNNGSLFSKKIYCIT